MYNLLYKHASARNGRRLNSAFQFPTSKRPPEVIYIYQKCPNMPHLRAYI